MKTRASLAALLLCLSGLGGLGCATTGMDVATVADEAPAAAETRYVIAPVSFEGFTVNGHPEQVWLATQTEAERAAWEHDKSHAAGELAGRMTHGQCSFEAAAAPPGPHVLVELKLISYETGVFQFAMKATNDDGRVVVAPSLITTRKHQRDGLRHGYRAFLMQAASAVGVLITNGGSVPDSIAHVEPQGIPSSAPIADAAVTQARVANAP